MWNQLLVVVLGLWITASPDVMGYEGPERLNNQIVGPLVISVAIIAAAETTRAMRWINVALGCWLMLAPVLLRYDPLHVGVRSSLVGLAVVGLSWLPGSHTHQLGGGWARLWADRPADENGDRSSLTAPVGRRKAG
jgi:hypothetical protein